MWSGDPEALKYRYTSDNNNKCVMASDGRVPYRIDNWAAKCEWFQTLRQLSKRSYSPGSYVLGFYVTRWPRHIHILVLIIQVQSLT